MVCEQCVEIELMVRHHRIGSVSEFDTVRLWESGQKSQVGVRQSKLRARTMTLGQPARA